MFKYLLVFIVTLFSYSFPTYANDQLMILADKMKAGQNVNVMSLSLNDKYLLDSIIRDKVGKSRNLSHEELFMKNIFDNISKILLEQNIYIDDISDATLYNLIQEEYNKLQHKKSIVSRELGSLNIASSGCEIQNFPQNLTYKQPTNNSFSKAYSYYDVKNDNLDFPCDIAFVFYGHKRYVYGLNQKVRDMIQTTYNNKLSYNTHNYNGEVYTRVIVGVRRFKHLLTADDLKQNLVTW